jgi:hypothetical protein
MENKIAIGLSKQLSRIVKSTVSSDDLPEKDDGIYSPDGNQRFLFGEIEDDTMRHQVLSLQTRLEGLIGWGNLMEVRLTNHSGKKSLLINLDAINPELDNEFVISGVNYRSWHDGTIQVEGGGSFRRLDRKPASVDKMKLSMRKVGFQSVDDLPPRIDVSQTAVAFLQQMEELDFSNPVLISAAELPQDQPPQLSLDT